MDKLRAKYIQGKGWHVVRGPNESLEIVGGPYTAFSIARQIAYNENEANKRKGVKS